MHEIESAARAYVERGWPIIPLAGKRPAVQGWQSWAADEAKVLLFWGRRRLNIGLRTGAYLVVDTDTAEAEGWAERLPPTPMTARSGGGSTHRYFGEPPRKEVRNRQGLHRIPGLDVRGHGGSIVLPPSVHPETGRPYEWTGEVRGPHELPRFSPAWVYRRRTRRRIEHQALNPSPEFMEFRASRWREVVARESPAVSGAGGSNATFKVAIKLTHYFDLGEAAAVRLMMAVYNSACRPPWSLNQIEKKVRDAIAKRR